MSAISELCILSQGTVSISISAPRLGAENKEKVETTHPVAHLHAGVEGPVHLGLDIHHLSNTEEGKARDSAIQRDRWREQGPQILVGPLPRGTGQKTLWRTEHIHIYDATKASLQDSVSTPFYRWGS